MHIFAIVNQKGGCGKTTTAINLAGVFAAKGRRTLLVDMDPQGHCAAGLAIPENRIDLHIGDAMLADLDQGFDPSRLLWRVSRNLDLAPSTVRLAAIEAPRGELAGKPDAERRLAQVLQRFDPHYDICLIDCSPAIGLLAFNALVAARDVLIPVETGFFSLQGANKQVNTIKAIGKRLGVAPTHRLLATMHDASSVLSKDLLEELKKRFTNRLVPVVVRYDQALREAASFGQPVVEYSPDSPGAKDYCELAAWLIGNVLNRASNSDLPLDSTPDPTVVVSAHAAQNFLGSSPPVPPVAAAVAVDVATMPASRAADVAVRAKRLQARADEAAATALEAPVAESARVAEVPVASGANIWPTATFGPQVMPHGVLFRVPASFGRRVAVAGDFNQWQPERSPLKLNDATGAMEATAFMPAGSTSQYRLVVDGQWVADPFNPSIVPNPFGGTNSVVSVPFVPGPGMQQINSDTAPAAGSRE